MQRPSRSFFRYIFKFGLCALVLANAVWLYSTFTFQRTAKLSEWTVISSNQSTVNVTTTTSYVGEPTSYVSKKVELPGCPAPDKLVGAIRIDYKECLESFTALNSLFKDEKRTDALFQPEHCLPARSVAIIIPFRDRQQHLEYLLGTIHPMLQRQLQSYQIFVVEQYGNGTFNKGRLMNTGFEYVSKSLGVHFDCFVFHDVDMLPENDKNIYGCGLTDNRVHHLSCSVNKFNYKALCCGMTVGGVLSFTQSQYQEVNGFPNNYWGWGGEDDDMNTRLRLKGLKVRRPNYSLCRYHMIKHTRDKLNVYVFKDVNSRVAHAGQMLGNTGLNNLNTKVLGVKREPLYVHIMVDVGSPGR